MGVILRPHPIRGESHIQRNANGEVATTSPPFHNETHRSHILFVKVFTQHDLHILVTAPFCCDRKARASSAQSFTLWQQATTEITCHDHSSRPLVVTFNRSHVSIGKVRTSQSLKFARHNHSIIACSCHINCTGPALADAEPNARPKRGAPLSSDFTTSSCSVNCVTIVVERKYAVQH